MLVKTVILPNKVGHVIDSLLEIRSIQALDSVRVSENSLYSLMPLTTGSRWVDSGSGHLKTSFLESKMGFFEFADVN